MRFYVGSWTMIMATMTARRRGARRIRRRKKRRRATTTLPVLVPLMMEASFVCSAEATLHATLH